MASGQLGGAVNALKELGILSGKRSAALTAPFLCLSRHRWRGRIFDLEPMCRATRPIRPAEPFRHDAFTAKRAGVFEDDGTVNDVVRIEHDAGMPVANGNATRRSLAILRYCPVGWR